MPPTSCSHSLATPYLTLYPSFHTYMQCLGSLTQYPGLFISFTRYPGTLILIRQPGPSFPAFIGTQFLQWVPWFYTQDSGLTTHYPGSPLGTPAPTPGVLVRCTVLWYPFSPGPHTSYHGPQALHPGSCAGTLYDPHTQYPGSLTRLPDPHISYYGPHAYMLVLSLGTLVSLSRT